MARRGRRDSGLCCHLEPGPAGRDPALPRRRSEREDRVVPSQFERGLVDGSGEIHQHHRARRRARVVDGQQQGGLADRRAQTQLPTASTLLDREYGVLARREIESQECPELVFQHYSIAVSVREQDDVVSFGTHRCILGITRVQGDGELHFGRAVLLGARDVRDVRLPTYLVIFAVLVLHGSVVIHYFGLSISYETDEQVGTLHVLARLGVEADGDPAPGRRRQFDVDAVLAQPPEEAHILQRDSMAVVAEFCCGDLLRRGMSRGSLLGFGAGDDQECREQG